MSRFKEADLSRVKTVSLDRRASRSRAEQFGHPFGSRSAVAFFDSLPRFLKASELLQFFERAARARRRGYPFHLLMGAHVIKVGLTPIIGDLIAKRIVTGISLNSAGLIHDLEMAFAGKTSEDVARGLSDGTFGMAAETGELFAEVVHLAEEESLGLGEAAGRYICKKKAPYRDFSLLALAEKHHIPATVHVVIGTDIVNQQPVYRAGPTAEASYRDFKILANLLIDADRGGVVANIGSAVVLPEIFLKALTVARNLKKQKSGLTTANFDMITHYRPMMNIVTRPTSSGGAGYNFIGHHEIMIPLLAWGLKAYVTKIKLESGAV